MNRSLIALTSVLVALSSSLFNAGAQTSNIVVPLPVFTGVSAGDICQLTVVQGSDNSVKLTTNDDLINAAQAVVVDGTLKVIFDDKLVSSDVKKLYKGKNAKVRSFKAVVTTDTPLKSLSLADKAVCRSVSAPFSTDEFSLACSDDASVDSLSIISGKVAVNMDKKSSAVLSMTASKVLINTTGNSNLRFTQDADYSEINAAGNSSVVSNGEAGTLAVAAKVTSRLILNGKAQLAHYEMLNSSNINAVNLSAEDAKAVMNGFCSLTESASKTLSVDIKNGAVLTFKNSPVITVVKVKTASLIPYGAE